MSATITKLPVSPASGTVVALCGGVGGAKLAHGLYQILPPGALTVIVNTADDFQHLSLHISPDLDTVLYTLGQRADLERGWGRADESWRFMSALDDIGGEQWFNIGDLDLAMHVERTHWLQWRKTLSAFAEHVAARFGICANIVPMTDDIVSTWVSTNDGLMPFQQYFVKEHCEPEVNDIHFEGIEHARPSLKAQMALSDPRLKAIIICPSNPYLSIDPMLAIPGMRDLISKAPCPIVAVSPIIGGKAIKGPTAKIMKELGFIPNWGRIAYHYEGLAQGLLIDEGEELGEENYPLMVEIAPILMKTLADRVRLAENVLEFSQRLAAEKSKLGASARTF